MCSKDDILNIREAEWHVKHEVGQLTSGNTLAEKIHPQTRIYRPTFLIKCPVNVSVLSLTVGQTCEGPASGVRGGGDESRLKVKPNAIDKPWKVESCSM